MNCPVSGMRSPALLRMTVYSPLIASSLFVLTVNLLPILGAFVEQPRDPWEAAIIVEAIRLIEGMTIYELPEDGHATHIYGPLTNILYAGLFDLFSVSNQLPRVASYITGITLAVLLTVLFTDKPRNSIVTLVTFVLFFGLNNRSGDYFLSIRPDMYALLIGILSLVFLFRGLEHKQLVSVLLGMILLAFGYLFKQTIALVAAIPVLALCLNRDSWKLKSVVLSLMPISMLLVLLMVITLAFPVLYHYTIEIPAQYELTIRRAIQGVWELFASSPLFIALLLLASVRKDRLLYDPRMRWVVAALLITIPASIITFAKVGGARNSFLPALLAMSAFCALQLGHIWGELRKEKAHVFDKIMLSVVVSMLLMFSLFPDFTTKHHYFTARGQWETGDSEYRTAIELASNLPGVVLAPEDQTITLYADKGFNRSIYLEFDSAPEFGHYPRDIPDYVKEDLRKADYIIKVERWFDLLTHERLEQLGFVKVPEMLRTMKYSLWQKESPPG